MTARLCVQSSTIIMAVIAWVHIMLIGFFAFSPSWRQYHQFSVVVMLTILQTIIELHFRRVQSADWFIRLSVSDCVIDQ